MSWISALRNAIPVFDWFLTSPFLFVMFLVAILPLYGAGRSFGVPFLFWNDSRGITILAGLGLGLLTVELSVVGFMFRHASNQAAPSLQSGTDLLVQYLIKVGMFALLLEIGAALKEPSTALASRMCLPLGAFAGLSLGYLGIRIAEAVSSRLISRGLMSSDPELHLISSMFFLSYGCLYLVLRRIETSGQAQHLLTVPPALAIAVLLGVFVAVWGFGSFWIRHWFPHSWPGVTALVVLVLALLNGSRSGAYRYPDLEHPGGALPVPINDIAALEAWKKQTGQASPVLAVVTVDGGGIRAGMWASVVLHSIGKKIAEFPYRTRLITGASGGLLGAASYVSALTVDSGDPGEGVIDMVSQSGLAPLASALAFQDLWIPGSREFDRGQALEQAWEKNSNNSLARRVADLRAGEVEGWRPSLVFTPMIVEKGVRLVIINLDLTSVLSPRNTGEAPTLSSSGYQLGITIPLNWARLKLSTAIRMNASFPYFLPPAVLPKARVGGRDEELRLVDAGYYDEQGANLAALWLWEHREWIAQNTSGVALLQTRDTPQTETGGPRTRRFLAALRRGFFDMTTPIEAVLSSLNTGMHRRNSAQIAALIDHFSSKAPDFFSPFIFPMNGEASLSWHLTESEKATVRSAIEGGSAFEELGRLTTWWADRLASASRGRE